MKTKYGNFLFGLLIILIPFTLFNGCSQAPAPRTTQDFCNNWKFILADEADAQVPDYDDSQWRLLDLPHDWSIEGKFDKENPAGTGGGALPGGIGWYRKSFELPESEKGKLFFIQFDGVYRNAEVWINGEYLGMRPYGYSSFEFELSHYLKFGSKKNVIAVKVDNSKQPNSRWYSGSGIYRNVWLTSVEKVFVDHWGTFITTPVIDEKSADVSVQTKLRNRTGADCNATLKTKIIDKNGNTSASGESEITIPKNSAVTVIQKINVKNPELWSDKDPNLYKAVSTVEFNGNISDEYKTTFGIRTFYFDVDKGFILNGKHLKIRGVCDHHDLGCLGAAVNTRALERQLEILKGMGVNGIRTSHNPPAPELLDLCDKMGFIVMDEAFDMWAKKKTEYDYALDWKDWHKRDLEDMVLRDRNHPSVFIWSIGNEVLEQYDHKDSSGAVIAHELAGIVRNLDPTRPITANCNDRSPQNPVLSSGALDLIGFSYGQDEYKDVLKNFPGQKFIASETTSALETRGHYDMPSDSIRRWPVRWDIPFKDGNPDHSVSAYDNVSAPWGGTHEEVLKIVKKYDFVSGMYIWTGFDYIGEPTPYEWPSRSSYFGIIDLAGFPKDVYYLYQSEWTDKPVLHIFPHWTWEEGQTVDVWAYTNCDEVELFLNGKSLGTKSKTGDELHLMWRLKFEPGTLKAVGRKNGKDILTQEIKTAGTPARISIEADRNTINADGKDLSFVTVKVLDKNGNPVPYADNLINFKITGGGKIAGVDNGSETYLGSLKADHINAFNGLCLVVVQSMKQSGTVKIEALSDGLQSDSIEIQTK